MEVTLVGSHTIRTAGDSPRMLTMNLAQMFLFILVLLLEAAFASSALAGTNDSLALLNLKQRVSDPLGTLVSWNESTNLCSDWKGIVCDSIAQGRVNTLRLHSLSSLSTSLLASLTEALSELQELSVRQSNFTDSIDSFNPDNCSLEVVDLSNNQLHGSFPDGLTRRCMQVRLLNLSHNRLRGELAAGDVFSSTLETVDVSDNSFTGSLSPRLFHTCESLRYLDLSKNSFTGQVPGAMLGNCMALEEISLAYNRFSGAFPSLNTSNNNIRRLILTSNTFSGGLHSSGFVPSRLEVLEASFNNFTGELPSLHDTPELKHLDLSSNAFITSAASLCSNRTKLESLILANNRLTGDFLTSVLDCSQLAMLDVSFNSLAGELPDNLCDKLPNLDSLLLTLNRLQGWIPSSLSSCSQLSILLLGYNNLQGVIPPKLSQLGKLWWLDLNNNNLSGTIPSSFGLLQDLEFLLLSGNSLHGEIPRELADCRHLVILELGSNNLTGSIPPYLGRRLRGTNSVNMDDYHVVGSIGNLRIIETLLPKCEFKGIVSSFLAQGITTEELQQRVRERSGCSYVKLALEPAFTYNLSSVIYLDLSDNRLTGSIPPELGNMETLFLFDAKHNLLSGTIPPELGKLRQIQVLDLSYNGLQGRIPAAIGELTFLKILNFSYNNLSGPIPQIGQLTTFSSSSYIGNSGLCGQPVSLNCSYGKGSFSSSPSPSSGSGLKADVLAIGFVVGLVAFLGCGTLVFFKAERLFRRSESSVDADSISLVSQTRSTWTLIGPSEALNILYRKFSS